MSKLIEWVEKLNSHVVWGTPMVVLMIGAGVFLCFVTGGVIFRRFGTVFRLTALSFFQKKNDTTREQGSVSPFGAVCTALAATVGTGNIVGVALAITMGGPGALFWLWVSALAGMIIKFCEVTLSVAYRTKNSRGELVGGPMYYISKGLRLRFLALLFAAFGAVASYGIGASVQANSLTAGIGTIFPIPSWVIGIAVALLAGLVIVGGIRRISNTAEVLVPFMAGFYIIGALVVLVINAKEIPSALASVFSCAFTDTAAIGGFAGASMRYACRIGMARGVFTHEAGMGSAPIAHATADTDHPARQGLWGTFEVFFDSIVMCTITGLVILTSGLWCGEPMNEAAMSAAAFENAFPGGGIIVSVGLVLFAFATIVAWYYYGETCVEYLFGGNRVALFVHRLLYIAFVFLGCIAELNAVWEFSDLFNGLMALPNLIALLVLAPVVRRLSRDFFASPNRIRPKDTDYSRFLKR